MGTMCGNANNSGKSTALGEKMGKDGPCRGEFPESGMIHPRTPPCERTLARARRGAHQPRPDGHTHRGRCSLNLRTMRTIRLAWAVSRQTLRAARVNELLNKLVYMYYVNLWKYLFKLNVTTLKKYNL